MKKFLFLVFGLFFIINIFSYTDDHNVIKGIYESKEIEKSKDASKENLQQPSYEQPKNTGIYEFKPKKTNVENAVKDIGDVVVSAGYDYQDIGLIPRCINIIERSEFKRYTNSGDVQDALEIVPGINIRRYGPKNALSTLSLRNSGSRQSLILINSIPVNDLGTQDTDLSLLDLSGIYKIEVVKGGLSSIYGANASAGVINLLSGQKEKKLILAQAGYGSNNTQKLVLSSNYKIFNLDYSITGSEEKSNGYFVNSDYLKRNAVLKANFGTENTLTEVSGYYAKRNNSIPYNEFGPTPEAKQYDEIFGLGLTEFLNLNFIKLKMFGYMRGGDLIYKDNSFGIDDRHIKKENLLQISCLYEEGNFFKGIAGLEVSDQKLNSTKAGDNSVNNNAYFANITLFLFEKLTLNTSGRIDNNQFFGQEKSGSIGLKYIMEQNIEVYGSLEYAFSMPTLMELFWDEKTIYDFGGGFTWTSEIYGNKSLKTEKSYSYEIGITKKDKNLSETISIFKKDVKDLIKWQVETDFLTYDKSQPSNLDSASIFGIEGSIKFMPFDFINTGFNYTYLYAIDGKTGEKLAYSPEDKITGFFEIILPFKSRMGLSGEYVDFRYDTKKRLVKDYYILNGYFIHKINENFSVNLNFYNLFDNKEYMVINNIPMPGREVMAGIDMEF